MVLLAVSVFAGAGTIHYQTPMLAAFAAAAVGSQVGWGILRSNGG